MPYMECLGYMKLWSLWYRARKAPERVFGAGRPGRDSTEIIHFIPSGDVVQMAARLYDLLRAIRATRPADLPGPAPDRSVRNGVRSRRMGGGAVDPARSGVDVPTSFEEIGPGFGEAAGHVIFGLVTWGVSLAVSSSSPI